LTGIFWTKRHKSGTPAWHTGHNNNYFIHFGPPPQCTCSHQQCYSATYKGANKWVSVCFFLEFLRRHKKNEWLLLQKEFIIVLLVRILLCLFRS
jgi:hypothetical protein